MKVFLILVILGCLCLDQSDAFFWKDVKRIFGVAKKVVGPVVSKLGSGLVNTVKNAGQKVINAGKCLNCPLVCRTAKLPGNIQSPCGFICGGCHRRGKRQVTPAGFRVVAMPKDFSSLDKNGNKMVSKEELFRFLHMDTQDIEEVFTFADADGDGQLTEMEYTSGTFVFQ